MLNDTPASIFLTLTHCSNVIKTKPDTQICGVRYLSTDQHIYLYTSLTEAHKHTYTLTHMSTRTHMGTHALYIKCT